ncbi:UDP-N-acetylglucosamine--N-acetylmuramyl-(pentapeptide) pyrophosphoryl-undecaprenol N-acetylglucosamine transferase [Patescibacteria group bacterium]|nr:UDP-N-acetylglucosamine--N-acetylmuramyl-(pentapeptide) pyrophosphoryl-undecaprenol N-acetylglucosamine transferase [Patescibacteria group bacterium]
MDKDVKKEKAKIMLSGGGSGGPVIPLLEITKELRRLKPELDFVFVGTENGPEKEMVENFGDLRFLSLPAGKLRRYFSFKNISDIFKIISAFFKAFPLLREEKPSLVISVGSFASVPLIYAAAFLRIPIIIHQQDVRPGLANRLMAPCAKIITAVFEKTLVDYGPKAILTGNPISIPEKFPELDETLKPLFSGDKPLVLILGGGTGAIAINKLVQDSKSELLSYCHLIHVTGRNKGNLKNETNSEAGKGIYLSWEFLSHNQLLAIMNQATLVVSRCGLATLTEISALKKASILIPMPKSHQEDNANIFSRAGAAKVLDQEKLDKNIFSAEIKNIITNKDALRSYANNAYGIMEKGAANKISKIILELIKKDEKEDL